ncbi:MAG: hypothetical protein IJ345_07735 [Clostridia bacterium]|nr:hypothetical protein [Clostridia bacterium]
MSNQDPHYLALEEDYKILDENVVYIENEYIKLGANVALGGAITYLAEHGHKNIINSWDWGRQVQLSFYSGPAPFHPEGTEMGEHWTHTPWNPIQTGDCFFNRSKVLEYKIEGNTMYVKCIPMQWALNNVPGECTFELWYTLDHKTVNVTARLNNNRSDETQYPARGQELPAVYTNGEFYKIVSYIGDRPGTDGELTEIVGRTTERRWPSEFVLYPESWVALVDDNNYGLGVYNPHTCGAITGFAGNVSDMGWGGAKDGQTSVISMTTKVILDHNIVYTFNYSLIVGEVDEIRKTALALDSRAEHRKFSFTEDRQNFYYKGTKDKGYGNQNCLDFDFEPKTALCSPHVFVPAGKCKRILLDAEIDGEVVEGNVVFSCYVDPTRQSDKRAFRTAQRLPFKLDGNCGRKIYEIDISALDKPFFDFSLEFLGSGHAKVYSVELSET